MPDKDPFKKYGIYNTCTRTFQFGICEYTPHLAMKRLFQKIGKDAYQWRFVYKKLPRDLWQKGKRE